MIKMTRVTQEVRVSTLAVFVSLASLFAYQNAGLGQQSPRASGLSVPQSMQAQPILAGQALKQRVTEDGWAFYEVKAPAHANGLKIRVQPIEGDVDLYIRQGGLPEGSRMDGGLFEESSALLGSQAEEVVLAHVANQRWYIGVHGYTDGEFLLQTELN